MYLKLQEYQDTAKRVIVHMRKMIPLSADNISDVAYAMMRADQKFDGRGVRSSYRIKCAKYMVMQIASKYKNIKPYNRAGQLHENLADNEILIDNSILAKHLIQKYCPLEYREKMTDRYISGMSFVQISEKYKCSRQNIENIVAKATKIMSKLVSSNDIKNERDLSDDMV